MSNPHYTRELKKLSQTLRLKKWLSDLAEEIETEPLDDIAFIGQCLGILQVYQGELQYRLDLTDEIYESDFEQLDELKRAIRSAEVAMRTLMECRDIPTARDFIQWLREMSADLSRTIFFIEERYPEKQREFDADRQRYADAINT